MSKSAKKIDAHVFHLDRGYEHVYTGDGKGKTTVALGLALRAAGSGPQVTVAAFMKNRDSGEFEMLEQRVSEGIGKGNHAGHRPG